MRAVAVGAAALLMVSGLTTTGFATETTGTPELREQSAIQSIVVEGHGTVSMSPEESEDLRAYLASEGANVSADEVAALRAQGSFSALVGAVADEYTDLYAGAALEVTERADAWILFTEQPPPAVLAQVAELPMTVEIRWGAPATMTELEAATAAALEGVSLARPDATLIAFSAPDGSALTVQYGDDASREDATVTAELTDAARTAVVDEMDDGLLPVPVEVEYDPDAEAETLANEVFGGGILRLASNHAAHCTAGFTGVRNGLRGVMTARHCDDLLRFGANPGWIRFIGVGSQTPAGNWIDLQFHRTLPGTQATNKFRATAQNGFRYATGASDPVLGQSVCKWGMTSGYTCSTVYSTNVCYKPIGLMYCGLFATAGNIASPGDSGGPFFQGTTARGLTSGSGVLDGARRTLATKISMAQTYMGTRVLTG